MKKADVMIPVIDKEKTGRQIRTLMERRGLSVQDVRAFLSLGCVQSIYHWLDGKSMPTLDNLYALSELFRMPVDGLLCGNRRYLYIPFADHEYKRVYTYYENLILYKNPAISY